MTFNAQRTMNRIKYPSTPHLPFSQGVCVGLTERHVQTEKHWMSQKIIPNSLSNRICNRAGRALELARK